MTNESTTTEPLHSHAEADTILRHELGPKDMQLVLTPNTGCDGSYMHYEVFWKERFRVYAVYAKEPTDVVHRVREVLARGWLYCDLIHETVAGQRPSYCEAA